MAGVLASPGITMLEGTTIDLNNRVWATSIEFYI
jgi:hypothetical protein